MLFSHAGNALCGLVLFSVLISTKALPLINGTRFTVFTINISHNIISPYTLGHAKLEFC